MGQVFIAVVIPCYRVKKHILSVVSSIGAEVTKIFVVDDACPEYSGKFVEENVADPRVEVIYHDVNQGVGGATLTGMLSAEKDGADIIVKIDGDGQMDPSLITYFTDIIARGEADYTKGNRFFEPEGVSQMPFVRLFGNAVLSLFTKISTGYWQTFDPTNGYIAIHSRLVRMIPIAKVSKRYFFESDLLFRLSLLRAKVVDIPMHSRYADEVSNLNPAREMTRFALGHFKNFWKRIAYNYFIRDFSIASIELVAGLVLCIFGLIFGLVNWRPDEVATAGTVMVAALPIIVGTQFILAFLNYDIQSVPKTSVHIVLQDKARKINK